MVPLPIRSYSISMVQLDPDLNALQTMPFYKIWEFGSSQ